MTVLSVEKLERHAESPVLAVFVTASGAETAMTSERDEFESAALFTPEHGTTVLRITAVDHFCDIFNDCISCIQCKNIVVMAFEYIL